MKYRIIPFSTRLKEIPQLKNWYKALFTLANAMYYLIRITPELINKFNTMEHYLDRLNVQHPPYYLHLITVSLHFLTHCLQFKNLKIDKLIR